MDSSQAKPKAGSSLAQTHNTQLELVQGGVQCCRQNKQYCREQYRERGEQYIGKTNESSFWAEAGAPTRV